MRLSKKGLENFGFQKKIILISLLLISLIIAIGCTSSIDQQETENSFEEETGPDTEESDANLDNSEEADNTKQPTETNSPVWLDTEFKDVNSGKTFKISDYDKPVIVESFAVWCPTCTRQQDEIKKLHADIGDAAISISLDTDPNEEENVVKAHTTKHGFDWLYAVSPAETTQLLIAQFGVGVVNAPSVPVIIVCNGKQTLLARGIKTASELKKEVESC